LRSPTVDYSLLQMAVYVFLGGAINAVVIKNYVDLVLSISIPPQYQITLQDLPLLAVLGVVVFLVPLLISFLLSRMQPEKRIIPPLYMQGVSIGLLLFFVYNSMPNDFLAIYTISFYAFVSGIAQDTIVIYALGKTAITDDIIKHSLKAHVNMAKMKEIITSKQFRKLHKLRLIMKEGESIKLRSDRRRGFQFILEIKESKQPNETIINTLAYNMGSYGIKHISETDDNYDYAKGRIAVLKEYFTRHYSIQIEDDEVSNTDSLMTHVLDEMTGTISRFQEMTTRKRLSIVIAIIVSVIGVGLIAYGRFDTGIAALTIVVALFVDIIR